MLLVSGAALALMAGCGGGSNGLNNTNNNTANSDLVSANFVASITGNQLLRFNSQTPNTVSTLRVEPVSRLEEHVSATLQGRH